MNPSTNKKPKRGTQEIPVPKILSSKKQEIEKQKIKESKGELINKEIKSSKNQRKLNSVLNNINQQNHENKNINKTETKNKIKKSCNSQTLLCNINDKIKENEGNNKFLKKDEKNIKNEDKMSNEKILRNSLKNTDKNKKTSTKHKISESDSFNDIDPTLDDNNNSQRNMIKIKSMDINKSLNPFNNLNKPSETDTNINKNYRKQLSTSNNPDSLKQNKEDIKSSKTMMTKKSKENNNDKLVEILVPDNEIDESKTNQVNNLKKTKFPNLSVNPFLTKIKKKSLNLNPETSKNISELKKNLKQNNTNNIPEGKEKEINCHIKSQTFNINESKSPTKNQNSNKASSNTPNILSNSKKTNPEFNENTNLEKIYRQLLTSAKRGDREKFLEIFRQILSIQKTININYKDENGYTALHYACDEGNLKIVEVILDANCNTNIKNIHKQTPLHLSTNRGYFDISKKLIESGAELNVEDSEKNSPLHYICKNNYIELLKYFLTKNPKVDEKNIYGKTPKDLATNLEIKSLLDEYIKHNKINQNETPIAIKNNTFNRNRANILSLKTQEMVKEKTSFEQESKNLLNKNELMNASMDIKKDKKEQNIIFQSTNNINNNNININIYSIDETKRTKTNTKMMSANNIRKNKYQMSDYISLGESHNNNSNSINKTKTSINNPSNKKKLSQSKIIKKSKFYQNNSKNFFDSIDGSDKNIFNLNKTEENIIQNPKDSRNINIVKNKNENVNLNNSANFTYFNKSNKDNNFSNNSKLFQSTEQLLSKVKQQANPRKKQSKFKPSKNMVDIKSKNHKLFSDLDIINRSNIIPSNAGEKLLNITTSSKENITASNFICLAQLGKGSFGEVYLVEKKNSTEKYAMKVLRKERIIGQNLLKYALAERNVLSMSNHPFIVKLSYAFQTSTKLFLVLEYCPNGDLANHLSFEKRFKEPRAKFYITEILLAIEDLHKRNVIFRDLKPDNVVLDKDGHCKLTDFGLSKEGMKENVYAQSFCGSIAYLAPEMLKKEGHGKAVDWYLLGVLFYEMLVGITPYFTTTKEDIFYNIEYGELKIPNFVSKEAAELLRRLLERNPNKRLGGSGRDAEEIKEHPYFKDVNWNNVYEKKIKPPMFLNYTKKTIKFYNKPKLFANDDFLNRTDDKNVPNMLKGWSFINQDEMI